VIPYVCLAVIPALIAMIPSVALKADALPVAGPLTALPRACLEQSVLLGHVSRAIQRQMAAAPIQIDPFAKA
jgi:hypothetical protein